MTAFSDWLTWLVRVMLAAGIVFNLALAPVWWRRVQRRRTLRAILRRVPVRFPYPLSETPRRVELEIRRQEWPPLRPFDTPS